MAAAKNGNMLIQIRNLAPSNDKTKIKNYFNLNKQKFLHFIFDIIIKQTLLVPEKLTVILKNLKSTWLIPEPDRAL